MVRTSAMSRRYPHRIEPIHEGDARPLSMTTAADGSGSH